jgi:hypothetical protein
VVVSARTASDWTNSWRPPNEVNWPASSPSVTIRSRRACSASKPPRSVGSSSSAAAARMAFAVLPTARSPESVRDRPALERVERVAGGVAGGAAGREGEDRVGEDLDAGVGGRSEVAGDPAGGGRRGGGGRFGRRRGGVGEAHRGEQPHGEQRGQRTAGDEPAGAGSSGSGEQVHRGCLLVSDP